MEKFTRIPKEFSSILQQEGVSLQSEGISDVALKPHAALRAIEILRSAQIGIVGGEVWERKDGRFFPTYDIWDVDRSNYKNDADHASISLDIAERQVRTYIDSHKDIFITLGI